MSIHLIRWWSIAIFLVYHNRPPRKNKPLAFYHQGSYGYLGEKIVRDRPSYSGANIILIGYS